MILRAYRILFSFVDGNFIGSYVSEFLFKCVCAYVLSICVSTRRKNKERKTSFFFFYLIHDGNTF